MKVFIDTNILLDLYRLSGPDLDELNKVLKLMKTSKVELLVSKQVEDEFWRNREDVISDTLKRFKETKVISKTPNIIRTYAQFSDLKASIDRVNNLVSELEKEVARDIAENKLKADELITQLFNDATPDPIPNAIVEKAKARVETGNPPGKKGSIGDAINWEWLLTKEMDLWDDELVVVSADGDFESELHKRKPKEFLLREWRAKNPGSELVLYKSLPDFLKDRFAEIRISDEVDKILAIEKIERSSNFATTHAAIALLNRYGDFSDSDVIRIMKAYTENDQISWILGDTDILEFAKKVISYAKSDAAKDATKIIAEKIMEIENADIL
ncbi:MAG: DUF4935 domain-containing protein [Nitrospira sp.]|nr:DUF4935 domain-containing protein [Nitrospira sp.]